MSKCSVRDCDRDVYYTRLCSKHYNRLRTTGTTDDGPKARKSLAERFWENVKRGSSEECWPWLGKSRSSGYGIINVGGRNGGKLRSHQVTWKLTKGDLPEGLVIRHRCNFRLCCNPYHLVSGTQADNVADMWANHEGLRGNSSLTETQVDEIRSDSRSSRAIAKFYNVSDAHIRSIRNGRTWKTHEAPKSLPPPPY